MAELIAARRPDLFVTCAHMEIAPPTLANAVERCIEAGALDIVVVPFFLGPGRHATEDIPRMVEEQSMERPQVRLRMTSCLGADPLLAQLVLERATPLLDVDTDVEPNR